MILQQFILPGLRLLPEKMDTPDARVLIVTIGLRESRFQDRFQVPRGPGRSFWQFEQIAIKHVLSHASTAALAHHVCKNLRIKPATTSCYSAIAYNDALAGSFARLNLWAYPAPLPRLGQPDEAWSYYVRVWKPGIPRPEAWDNLYGQAVKIVTRN
jgi:hypothetical protein